MEEDPESKHICKFCRRSFPNGRSLGGHMRSHICNLSVETEQKLNNGGNNIKGGEETGYDLRENPKKTWRFAVSKVQTSEKFCKECGKGFHSWKALFGHMKRHSRKEKFSNCLKNDQDSSSNGSQKLVMDSQSDNESAAAPNQRRRSSRRTTRYMSAASNSSLSFVNNPSSSVPEIEQEQEEVAMSLMMLSRDLGTWGGLNFAADSSDNNSACFEAKSSVRTNLVSKIEGKMPSSSGSELAKLKKLSDKKLQIGNSNSAIHCSKGKRSSQLFATGSGKIGLTNEKAKKSEVGCNQSAMEVSDDEQRKKEVNANKKLTSIKRKFLDTESSKTLTKNSEKAELSMNIDKRGKFVCTTCNKIFNSYQALGGHKASHKKIKGISSENSIETDPTTEISKLMNNNSNNSENEEHDVGVAGSHHDEAENVSESKKSKGHECPICLKVFSSGQALGGHKRSHLAESSSRNFQTSVAIQEPVEEIRDLLDLNLPAADREVESNSQADESESYRAWWVGSNHKQEALVGL